MRNEEDFLNGSFSVASIRINQEVFSSGVMSRMNNKNRNLRDVNTSITPEHYKNGFGMIVTSHGETIYSWNNYLDLCPQGKDCLEFELRAGEYEAAATLGNMNVEGFNEPSYAGRSTFTIVNGENTALNLECNLTNSKFRIEYTDRFKSCFSTCQSTVKTGLDGTFLFDVNTTDFLYVHPDTITVKLDAGKPGGAVGHYDLGQYVLEGQHEYILTLDADIYANKMSVHFSEDVAEESMDIDIVDEVLNVQAPVMKILGFANGDQIELTDGATAEIQYQVHVNAQARLKSFVLKMESSSPAGTVWNNEFDLAASIPQELTDLGLKLYGFGVEVSQMSMLDLTEVIKNVPIDVPVTFTVHVVDRLGKTSDTDVSLTVTRKSQSLPNV